MTTTSTGPADTLLINGSWRTAASTFEVLDPATLDVIGLTADAGADEAVEALDAATNAFDEWRYVPAEQRAEILRGAAGEMRAQVESLASLMTKENGKPLAESRGEVVSSARMLEWAAEEGRRANGRITPPSSSGPGLVMCAPVGPALAITPWNFPASMLVRKVGMALAAGCPVIVKPAEQTPLIATELVRIFDNAGLPPAALQSLTTSRPDELVRPLLEDPRLRKISFTGSTEVGLRLARSTEGFLRRYSLEMGGHSPAIVFEDTDLEAAADGVVSTKFANAGQSCISINRLYVHRSVHERFVSLVKERVLHLRVGNGADDGTKVGPLIDFSGLDKVERHVRDAAKQGATVIAGGNRWTPDHPELKGAFFEPTILDGIDETMEISNEETFGPVLPIYVFDTEAEVLERANSTGYGLAAYVYTSDLGRTYRVLDGLDFGVIGVNEPFPVRPELPFGGMKNSGQEREGGIEGIEAYLETKSISMRI